MGKGWKNPKKAAIAQKKGKVFTKLAREIYVAARLGSPDPDANPRLKMAINAAKSLSCPNDTINRAIKKGSGQTDSGSIDELTYEGHGPHKVGIIVECQTDNKNRTISDVRTFFKKNGGALGESGSVQWMFEKLGVVEGNKKDIADAEEVAIEVGANDVEKDPDSDDSYVFYTDISDINSVRDALLNSDWKVTSASPSYKTTNITELDDTQKIEVLDFLDALDDLDDVSSVHASI